MSDHKTTIEVEGLRYVITLHSVPREEDAPRYVQFARDLIRHSDNPPSGMVEKDGVLVRIAGVVAEG